MGKSVTRDTTLKNELKQALAEALHEQRDLLREVFLEVVEDWGLKHAIQEGLETKRATHGEVVQALRSKA